VDELAMEIQLNPDQVKFIESIQEKYKIRSSDKVVRILLDYALTEPNQQDTIFTEHRCLRCG
tara:strand:+ start:3505 stop:3690 length:186 start_codon:yes stop_codon:yes gene_type:complete